MAARTLWVLFYALLRSMRCLRGTFFHEWHGLDRRHTDDPVDAKRFSLVSIREMIISLLSFEFSNQDFAVGELVHLILQKITQAEWDSIKEKKKQALKQKIDFFASMVGELQKEEKLVLGEPKEPGAEEKFREKEGGLINVYRTLTSLVDVERDGNLSPDFFRIDFSSIETYQNRKSGGLERGATETLWSRPISREDFISARKKSISYGLRSDEPGKFMSTFNLQQNGYLSEQARDLIASFEEFLFQTSECGMLHWIFAKTKQLIRHAASFRGCTSSSLLRSVPDEQPNADHDEELDPEMDAFWHRLDSEKQKPEPKVVPPVKRKRAEKVH